MNTNIQHTHRVCGQVILSRCLMLSIKSKVNDAFLTVMMTESSEEILEKDPLPLYVWKINGWLLDLQTANMMTPIVKWFLAGDLEGHDDYVEQVLAKYGTTQTGLMREMLKAVLNDATGATADESGELSGSSTTLQ